MQVVATLAVILGNAYLTAIRARDDSLVIDGLAEHASRVFDALQRSNVVIDVKVCSTKAGGTQAEQIAAQIAEKIK